MPSIIKTRQLYESYRSGQPNTPGGRRGFVNQIRHGLGLCDENGSDYKDRVGNRILRESKFTAEEFSTSEMAVAIMGHEVAQRYANDDMWARSMMHRNMVESVHPGDSRALLEAVGVGVDVSAFADINAWTAATGGLIERKILEGFSNPAFIGGDLMPEESTKINEGQKVIGVSRIGDKAIERMPGMPHRRAGVTERFVTLNKCRENGLAVDVYKEAVFFDLTGQLLQNAGNVGEWIGYRKEIDTIDAFIGVTTGSTGLYKFIYDGTAYDTYSLSQTVGGQSVGFTNQQANELIDWTSLEAAWLLFVRMRDPETNTRILINPNTILINPGKLATAKLILGAKETERRTAGTLTQATAATLQIARTPGTPFGGEYTILWSPLVEQRCTDSDGLALTQTNATKRWWMFEKGRAMKYMVNWPMTIVQAPANTYEMIDRGIAATFFANERGMPSVWSVWHTSLQTA